jgi:hypothetical protein
MRNKKFRLLFNLVALDVIFFFIALGLSELNFAADMPTLQTYTEPQVSLLPEQWFFDDYKSVVIKNTPDQEIKYLTCIDLGDSGCALTFGRVLAERSYIGIPSKYSDQEIVFMIRMGLCDIDKIIDDSKDGLKLTCSANLSLAASYISKFYEKGILGFPKNQDLSECWSGKGSPFLSRCLSLESKKFGSLVKGIRPSILKNFYRHQK